MMVIRLVYDSLAGHFQWSSANLLMARENAIATPLPDGRVLIVGGYDGADQGVTLSDSEIYDPAIAIVARLYLRIINSINHISDFDFYINELQSLSNIFYSVKLR